MQISDKKFTQEFTLFLNKEIMLTLTILTSIDGNIFKFWIQKSLKDLLVVIVQNCDNHIG